MDSSAKAWIVVGAAIALLAYSTQRAHNASPRTPAVASASNIEQAPSRNYCGEANRYEAQAASDVDAGDYHGAYRNAVHGLTLNDRCSDVTSRLQNEGYLLSMKGTAEHYLSVGDASTDLNQANMLLVQCQTRPGLYGTRDGAQCETQERNNISYQTRWDLGQ